MRLLEAPQTWIVAAVVLLVIAIVLLLLARRQRRTSSPAPEGVSAASASPESPDATAPDETATPGPAATTAASSESPADPPTGPIDLRGEPARPAGPAPAPAPTADPTAKDRLLAALLADPAAAVHAVDAIGRANGSGPSGDSVASLLRAGMTPAQVASLCGTRESALAEIVARDLGLLSGRNDTVEPGRAWASAGSAAGSTTPTTG